MPTNFRDRTRVSGPGSWLSHRGRRCARPARRDDEVVSREIRRGGATQQGGMQRRLNANEFLGQDTGSFGNGTRVRITGGVMLPSLRRLVWTVPVCIAA